MNLICPSCGSTELVYAGTSTLAGGAYEATDQRYTCKNCGYSGPLVIDTDLGEAEGVKDGFPARWILLLALIAVSLAVLGADPTAAALVFVVPASIVLIIHYSLWDGMSVEDDLKNLDAEGNLVRAGKS